MADLTKAQVTKRDGKQEPYSRQKLVSSMVKAGASSDQAESVANQVEAWLEGVVENGPVATSEIRTKVIEFLTQINTEASNAYQSYNKEA